MITSMTDIRNLHWEGSKLRMKDTSVMHLESDNWLKEDAEGWFLWRKVPLSTEKYIEHKSLPFLPGFFPPSWLSQFLQSAKHSMPQGLCTSRGLVYTLAKSPCFYMFFCLPESLCYVYPPSPASLCTSIPQSCIHPQHSLFTMSSCFYVLLYVSDMSVCLYAFVHMYVHVRKARSWCHMHSAIICPSCFSTQGLFLHWHFTDLDKLSGQWISDIPLSPPSTTQCVITGICCHAGLFIWFMRTTLRSLCLPFLPSAQPCYFTALPCCVNLLSYMEKSKCTAMEWPKNWGAPVCKILSFETSFWPRLFHDKSCHCKTMRVSLNILNVPSK